MLVLYLLLLVGSLSLGLEAMMLGMGGKIVLLYRKRPLFVLGMSVLLGFSIVVLSLSVGVLLGLEALHICVLAFVFTVLLGKVVERIRPHIVREFKLLPEKISDRKIKQMLKQRGIRT